MVILDSMMMTTVHLLIMQIKRIKILMMQGDACDNDLDGDGIPQRVNSFWDQITAQIPVINLKETLMEIESEMPVILMMTMTM